MYMDKREGMVAVTAEEIFRGVSRARSLKPVRDLVALLPVPQVHGLGLR